MSIVAFALTLLASYCCIGAAIKLIDDLHDSRRQSNGHSTLSWTLTTGTAALVALWASIDAYTDGLALALLLGLVMTRKVDNRHFLALALATLPFVLLPMLRVDVLLLVLPMLLALAPAAAADEVLDAVGPRLRYASLRSLTKYRPIMKVVVLLLPVWGLLTLFHTIAFWGFDVAYAFVGYCLRAPAEKR
jgi:hypothetical protein